MDSDLIGVWHFKSSMAKSTAEAMQLLKAADPDTHPSFPTQCPVLYRDQSYISSGSREKCSRRGYVKNPNCMVI